jgi:hypothetical protein
MYARTIGFRLDDRDNQDAERSSAVAAAMQRINALTGDVQNRIKSQADFECFVFGLEAQGQQSQYLTFLRSIMEPFDIEGNLKWDETYEKVHFDPPSQNNCTCGKLARWRLEQLMDFCRAYPAQLDSMQERALIGRRSVI